MTNQVTRELGQVVTQFVDSENNPAAAPAGSVRDVPAMVERLKALRMAVVEAEAAERALLDQCQQAGGSGFIYQHGETVTDHSFCVLGGPPCRSCSCCRPSRSRCRET